MNNAISSSAYEGKCLDNSSFDDLEYLSFEELTSLLEKETERNESLKRDMETLKDEEVDYLQQNTDVKELEDKLAELNNHLNDFYDMVEMLEESEKHRRDMEQRVVNLKCELADMRSNDDWNKLQMKHMQTERDELKREIMRAAAAAAAAGRRANSERTIGINKWKEPSRRRFSVGDLPKFRIRRGCRNEESDLLESGKGS